MPVPPVARARLGTPPPAGLPGIGLQGGLEVRPDLLVEEDGPTLLHGIQGMHRQKIVLPRRADLRPDPERLEVRHEAFRASAP